MDEHRLRTLGAFTVLDPFAARRPGHVVYARSACEFGPDRRHLPVILGIGGAADSLRALFEARPDDQGVRYWSLWTPPRRDVVRGSLRIRRNLSDLLAGDFTRVCLVVEIADEAADVLPALLAAWRRRGALVDVIVLPPRNGATPDEWDRAVELLAGLQGYNTRQVVDPVAPEPLAAFAATIASLL